MRRPSTLGAGWMPMQPPVRRAHRLWPRIRHQLLIFGGLFCLALLTGLLRTGRGWLVIGLVWALLGLLGNAPSWRWRFTRLTEWAAVAALAVVVATGAQSIPPKVKTPVQVEATQTDQLAQTRCGVVNLYVQLSQGFPALPDATPCPTKPKGGR